MANDFKITVSAVDHATATVRNIKKSLISISSPVTDVTSSLSRLSKETGLDKVSRGLSGIGKSAGNLAAKMSGVAAPFQMLTGASVLGGIAALTMDAARMGQSFQRMSIMTGVSTSNLQTFGGAAKISGATADAMTKSLSTLGSVMQDAVNGRNQEALYLFNRLGVTLRRTKDGAMDAADMFEQLADVIARTDSPQTADLITKIFGSDASLIPLLKKGSVELRQLRAEVEGLGGTMSAGQIENAHKFSIAIDRLGIAAEGAGLRLADKFLPSLTSAANAWTNLISRPNSRTAPAAIGSSLTAGAGAIAGAKAGVLLGSFAPGIGTLVGGAAGAIGGAALGGLGGMWWYGSAGDSPRAIGAMPPKLSQVLTGSLGFRQNNPGNLRAWGNAPIVNGYAMFPDAQSGLSAMAGNLQAYSRNYGLNTVSGIVSRWAPRTENDTASYISDVSRQTGFGPNQTLNLSDPTVVQNLMKAMIRHENGSQPYGDDMIAQAVASRQEPQKAQIEVVIKNESPGTQVSSRSTGDAEVRTRVETAMPSMVAP